MARATTFVRSRNAPGADAISFPVLTYTDALPRNDLRELDGNGSTRLPEQGRVAQVDFPRPRNTDGKEIRNQPPGAGAGATFDFRLTAPPDEVFPSSAGTNRSPGGVPRIGVALGSPSMLDSRENLPPPRFNTEIFSQEQVGQISPPRKPSTWKKIGGLFKAKNALAAPINQSKGPLKQPVLEQKSVQSNKPMQRRGLTDEWPKIETDPRAAPSGNNSGPQRSRKVSLSETKTSADKPSEQGPFLNVNIPDIQMERYSVMFSHVMNKNQRPSLLARRSKTLDNLSVPNNQVFMAGKIPPVPQRRATSPARSSFTLFPASQPSKAAQMLGTQNFSRGPSPLLRANTLPVESPSKESTEQSWATPTNNRSSPFGSPMVPNLFAQHSSTPRSSLDKPLPPIKLEPQVSQIHPRATSKLAVSQVVMDSHGAKEVKALAPQSGKSTARTLDTGISESSKSSRSPQKEEKPSPEKNSRARKPSLAIPGSLPHTQQEKQSKQQNSQPYERPSNLPVSHNSNPIYQERKSSLQAPRAHMRSPNQPPTQPPRIPQAARKPSREMDQRSQQMPQTNRPPRPNLKIQTTPQAPPRPPLKDKSFSGSSCSTLPTSTPPTSTLPTPNMSKESLDRTPSPVARTLSSKPGVSPDQTTRLPFVSEPEEIEIEIGIEVESKGPTEASEQIPTIEVSTARSISVSRARRQILVPVGARVDPFNSNERYVERKALTPRIMGVTHGHKHAVSQELQIESL
ncbi:uncharacterized protein N7482_009110 [Penicillium canariense]|uniref:Uncharacterized protein n=1 Tax=Penicillium canariense TaxID=189055 RepID=A0A9W9LFR3_9EURO|nr:uncharacterized protein N7482_009110 [Penicillium canariense]KAJ5152632.1 hypothetical protein N7482_009110 [Penicillium canariense]